MQMKRCVPGVRTLEEIVVSSPAGMKLGGPKKNVGGVGVPKRISLIGGTIPPPPNCVTWVNVCVSPPRFSTVSEFPAFTFTRGAEKCQAPANLFSVNSWIKTSNGVPPLRVHAVGSWSATLNEGLQASLA